MEFDLIRWDEQRWFAEELLFFHRRAARDGYRLATVKEASHNLEEVSILFKGSRWLPHEYTRLLDGWMSRDTMPKQGYKELPWNWMLVVKTGKFYPDDHYGQIHEAAEKEAALFFFTMDRLKDQVEWFLESTRDPSQLLAPDGRTLLHLAVAAGQKEILELILNKVEDNSKKIVRRPDALGMAALLEDNSKKIVRRSDALGMTALLEAVKRGDEGIVKILLEKGAQPVEERDIDGKTALHYAAQLPDDEHKAIRLAELVLAQCFSEKCQSYRYDKQHGKRIAVIENEYGEVDIDGSLVATQTTGAEDIVMLNNGCLCCTVRGDLVRMLSELVRTKRDKFDHIVIETTGLANPAPVIQTFYMDHKVAHHVRLDGVVTLVDSKHAMQHLDEDKGKGVVNEAVEQVAYADRLILNKIDLVGDAEMDALTQKIKRINAMAQMKRAKFGKVEIDYVLGIGGFDLDRIESEVKVEETAKAHDDHHHHHEHDHKHKQGGHNHDQGHGHTHDPGVSSVSIVCDGTLDLDKINDWMGQLVNERSEDIYRMKGVLSVDGFDERYVFQGVHSIIDGSPNKPWGPHEKRTNKIVFIGKNLDEASLRKGFTECLM